MENARYVGRVGALAVALGIGAGAWLLPGTAWAAPTDTDSSSSAASAKHTEKKSDSSHQAASESDGADDAGADSDTDKPSAGEDADPATSEPDDVDDVPSRTSRKSTSSKPSHGADRAVGDAGAPDDESEPVERDVAATPPTSEPAGATVVPVSLWQRTLSPPAPSSSPAAPAEPTLLWAVLAFARRQFDPRRAEIDKAGAADSTTALLEEPAAASSDPMPGRSAGPVIVAPDGTLYQVTYEVDPATRQPTATRVSILDEDGNVVRTSGAITGVPVEQTRAVVRQDGRLVLTTHRTSTNTTVVSLVDHQGAVTRLGSVIGQPSVPLEVGPDGSIYLQTSQFPTGLGYPGDRLVRISPTNRIRTYQIGRAGSPVTFAPNGTGYISARSFFGTQSVLAISSAGTPRRVLLPRSDLPNEVLIGADGRGYLTVARSFFGKTSTRVYTFAGTSSTVREIIGAPVGLKAVAADGVYQATYDAATGTSYISKITATTIETSDAINGSVINTIAVTPDGTVYVSIHNQTTQTDSVAVVSADGTVETVAIPGTIVLVASPQGSSVGYVANPDIDGRGYVTYTAGGATYVAVLSPDGTIDRTVALPAGASIRDAVTFGPDGAPYQVIQYRTAQDGVVSLAVITLTNDAVSGAQPGTPLLPNYPPLQFGPDGTAYLVTQESGQNPAFHFVGIDRNGTAVSSLNATGFLVPQQLDYVFGQEALAFGADGTAYATLIGEDAGVWALTPGGGTQVLDLELSQGATVDPVTFGPDGTPYVTVSEFVGGAWVTTVRTFAPPASV